MNIQALKKSLSLAKKVGFVYVATADSKGLPHIAIAGKLMLTAEGALAVTAWFCLGTVENLKDNPHVSIVVWDRETDTGFQLLGHLEAIEELGALDGYTPELEGKRTLPQVQRQLLVRVDKILEFKRAPHSDIEGQ